MTNLLNDYDLNNCDGYYAPGGIAIGVPETPQGMIYISGPMRGIPDFNFPAFYTAERYLKNVGWRVGNPARMDMEDGTPPANIGVNNAMKRDADFICGKATALFMLKGWEKSTGAQAEWALARAIGLPIYYQETI